MATSKDVSFDELTRELDRGIAGADTLRADRLDGLAAMRAVKEKRARREQERLAAKVGSTHRRVTQIDQQLTMNAMMMRDLKLEAGRARTETPQVDANTWMLHGFVRDKTLKGVSNLTVALFDSNGRRTEGVGHGCTEANGYFRITSKNVTNVGSAFVRVLARDGSVLYVDKNALQPQAGTIDYREIILSGEDSVCVPPPESGGPSPTPDDKPPRDYWVVRGRVTDKSGRGLGGLFVSVYDKDLFFDDRLGQAETDAQGNYSLTYRTEDFRDLFERKPDLYLRVIDRYGNTLHTVKGQIFYESGRVETIDIVVPWGTDFSDTQPLNV